MLRYARLLAVQLRTSLLLAMQYRLDFALDAVMALFWSATAVIPLVVLYHQRPEVAGWTWPEALIVVGWFTCLKGFLDGAIRPSLGNVVEHVRKGTLDFILLKPADAQFLVSTTRFDLFAFIDVFAGVGLVAWAFRALGRAPTSGAVALTALLLAGALGILYAMWILVVCLAFVVVKVDNLSFLFATIFDAARWPSSVFRGFWAFAFTFVVPLAVMTTFPARAILGRLDPGSAVGAIGASVALLVVARVVWKGAIGRYTSAGG
jgi:viologen exporter family transport system permease protein